MHSHNTIIVAPCPGKPHIVRQGGLWRVSPMPPPYGQSTWLAAHALASRLNNARAFKGYASAPAFATAAQGALAISAPSPAGEAGEAGEARDVGPGLLASPIFALYISAVIVTGAILAIIW